MDVFFLSERFLLINLSSCNDTYNKTMKNQTIFFSHCYFLIVNQHPCCWSHFSNLFLKHGSNRAQVKSSQAKPHTPWLAIFRSMKNQRGYADAYIKLSCCWVSVNTGSWGSLHINCNNNQTLLIFRRTCPMVSLKRISKWKV